MVTDNIIFHFEFKLIQNSILNPKRMQYAVLYNSIVKINDSISRFTMSLLTAVNEDLEAEGVHWSMINVDGH